MAAALANVLRRQQKGGDETVKVFKRKNLFAKAARWLGTDESEKEIRALGALTEMDPRTARLLVSTPKGVELAELGAWVVNTEGVVSVWAHEEFVSDFEEGE